MNGNNQQSKSNLPARHILSLPTEMEKFKPLAVALVVSMTCHAAVVLLPYLGRNSEGTQRAHNGARQSKQPRLQIVDLSPTRLRLENGGAENAANPRVAGTPGDEEGKTDVSIARSNGADLLPLAAPAYYPTDQLTKRPQPEVTIDFDAPSLEGNTESGKIILKIWIDTAGRVADVQVEKSELPDAITDPIVGIFKRSQFVPGERGGQRVGSVMKIEVNIDSRPPLH